MDIVQLETFLKYHADRYYNGQAEISDAVWDEHVQQYRALTGKDWAVGADAKGTKLHHTYPMRSLDNLFLVANEQGQIDDFTVVKEWIKKINQSLNEEITYYLEPKYDGLALNLHYYQGRLINIATRGDGIVGESVMAQLKGHLNAMYIPESVPFQSDVEIRGEVVLDKMAFMELNAGLPESKQYVNPRNAAAGILRASEHPFKSRLTFIAYDWMSAEKDNYQDLLALLPSLGFYWDADSHVKLVNWDDRTELVVRDIANRAKNGHYVLNEGLANERFIDIDGVVLKVDQKVHRGLLGSTSHHPNWSIAVKFPSLTAETLVKEIRLQVGRTGVVTPVAELEPVFLSGVTVSRATLNNQDFIRDLNVNVGDKVKIRRAGEVIPEVLAVVTPGEVSQREGYFKLPLICPACHSELKEQGPKLACWNEDCSAVVLAQMSYAVSRECLNIVGIGEAQLSALYSRGLVEDVADVFDLDVVEIKSIWPGLTGDNLFKAIRDARVVSLAKLIQSLSLPMVGKSVSKDLALLVAKRGHRLQNLLKIERSEVACLTGYGKVFLDAYFKEPYTFSFIGRPFRLYKKYLKLIDSGKLIVQYPKVSKTGPLAGEVICITGGFNMSRDALSVLLEELGAKVVGSVSKEVSILLAGAGSTGTAKMKKAQSMGIRIVDDPKVLLGA